MRTITIVSRPRSRLLTSLSVSRRGVGAPFISGKIDQRELSVHLVRARDARYDLEHRVRSRGVGIGARLAARSRTVAVLYQLQHLVASLHHLLR